MLLLTEVRPPAEELIIESTFEVGGLDGVVRLFRFSEGGAAQDGAELAGQG